ncbi:hypothetical protein N0V88_005729 [Collariella sp. IMI 366227]|nr:hypothetical protein N0V88_005729 [Collariella sp. IMI 366227]
MPRRMISISKPSEKNLESILKLNLEELLEALNSKMNDNSVVVVNGYAHSTRKRWLLNEARLDHLQQLNNLVVKINALIKSVVEGTKDKYKYKIGFFNWDVWPSDGVRGQFCDSSSSGEYPDSKQPDMQFFKIDTRSWNQDGHVTARIMTQRDTLHTTYSIEPPWVKELFEKDRQRAALDDTYNSLLYFCDGVVEGDDKVNGWTYMKWFDEGTLGETEFRVPLGTDGTGSTGWRVAEFKDSMRRIMHRCNGNDKENPMNWKFGGEWKRGRFMYRINPKRDNWPWPVHKKAWGSCEVWYHGWWSSYVIKGKGWATNNWGQKEDGLLDKAKHCIGGGLTMWRFKYFDKAVREAGGFTNGCGGND